MDPLAAVSSEILALCTPKTARRKNCSDDVSHVSFASNPSTAAGQDILAPPKKNKGILIVSQNFDRTVNHLATYSPKKHTIKHTIRDN